MSEFVSPEVLDKASIKIFGKKFIELNLYESHKVMTEIVNELTKTYVAVTEEMKKRVPEYQSRVAELEKKIKKEEEKLRRYKKEKEELEKMIKVINSLSEILDDYRKGIISSDKLFQSLSLIINKT